MPALVALVAGVHDFRTGKCSEDVDGRDKHPTAAEHMVRSENAAAAGAGKICPGLEPGQGPVGKGVKFK
jgi:hypothetical protein